MDWIKCRHLLPLEDGFGETSDIVLVWGHVAGDPKATFIEKGFYFYPDGHWAIGDDFVGTQDRETGERHVVGAYGATSTITHWMPLPEPPKEDEK